MTKEQRGCPLVLKGVNEDEGIVEAVVSVYNNIDSVGDRIKHGAFAESLQKKLPKVVWMHDWNAPVAKTLEANELEAGDERLPEEVRNLGGLLLKMKFNKNTQRGREAFSDIKEGIIDEFSIGFSIEQENNTGDIREIEKGRLYEASPVLYGANPETRVVDVKSGLNDHIELTGESVTELVNRVKDRAEIREKEGRKLSGKNIEALQKVRDAMQSGAEAIDGILETNAPKPKDDDAEKALIARAIAVAQLQKQGIKS